MTETLKVDRRRGQRDKSKGPNKSTRREEESSPLVDVYIVHMDFEYEPGAVIDKDT